MFMRFGSVPSEVCRVFRKCQDRVIKPIKERREKCKKLKNGEEEMSDRKAYPSDLTDAEWEILEPLIPARCADAVHVKYTRREIVNAILYVLRSGCPWRLLPNDLPVWGTVYDYFRMWQKQGIWDQALEALRKQLRKVQGRDEEPSAAVIDSQSIKTSAVRGEAKGFDMGKKIWGRKRHALVDTEGNLMDVKVTGAADSDLAGGKTLFELLRGRFPRLMLIWGDSHYGGKLREWVKEQFGWDVQTVRRLGTASDTSMIEPKPTTKPSTRGFVLEPRRWVVERSFSWIVRWRRLARDHEGLPQSSEAFIKISAFRRMLSHLAPALPLAMGS
jgi:putative transposase